LGKIHDKSSTSVVIVSTPGFRVTLSKMWSLLPQLKVESATLAPAQRETAFELALSYLTYFIRNLDFNPSGYFEEIVDGVRGSGLSCRNVSG
jgi:hypothetical protein